MTERSEDPQPPAPPFPAEPEPGAPQIDAGAQQLPEDEPPPLHERVTALEEKLAAAPSGDGGPTFTLADIERLIQEHIAVVQQEVSNVKAAVGRAVGIDFSRL